VRWQDNRQSRSLAAADESISLIGAEVRSRTAGALRWQFDEPWEVGISIVEFNRARPQARDPS